MERDIVFPLSTETEPSWDKAVKEVKESQQNGGTIVRVRKSDDGQGNPVGIIVVNEPI